MQPQRNRQDEFPSLLLRWKSRDLFWMISSVSMIISSCPRFRMFFPNCLSPILDDFPIIVIISPHSRISGFSGCRKIIFLSFSCWSGDIWSFRDQQSIISIYFYIFLYISIYFYQIPPKLPQELVHQVWAVHPAIPGHQNGLISAAEPWSGVCLGMVIPGIPRPSKNIGWTWRF